MKNAKFQALKGQSVKVIYEKSDREVWDARFTGCYVAEIEQNKLTILGFYNGKDKEMKEILGKKPCKVYCIKDVPEHKEEFEWAFNRIENNIPLYMDTSPYQYRSGKEGEPICAFE